MRSTTAHITCRLSFLKQNIWHAGKYLYNCIISNITLFYKLRVLHKKNTRSTGYIFHKSHIQYQLWIISHTRVCSNITLWVKVVISNMHVLMSYKPKEQIRHLQEEPNTQKWKHLTPQIQLGCATFQILYSNQYMDSYMLAGYKDPYFPPKYQALGCCVNWVWENLWSCKLQGRPLQTISSSCRTYCTTRTTNKTKYEQENIKFGFRWLIKKRVNIISNAMKNRGNYHSISNLILHRNDSFSVKLQNKNLPTCLNINSKRLNERGIRNSRRARSGGDQRPWSNQKHNKTKGKEKVLSLWFCIPRVP